MNHSPPTNRARRGSAWLILLVIAVIAGGGMAMWLGLRTQTNTNRNPHALTQPLQRGPVKLTVLATGSLEAQKSHIVTNRVEGRTTIIAIVPEGSTVTDEDVANKRILVRLDSSNIDERIAKQEIDERNAKAGLNNSQSSLKIQIHQNTSDIQQGRFDLRFARLDLERYVGSTLVKTLSSEDLAMSAPEPGSAPESGAEVGQPGKVTGETVRVDAIADMLNDERLSGEALQKIRQLDSDITLADEELRRAEDKLKNSERLHGKGYVSGEELDADKLALQRRKIDAEKARTARSQYVVYDYSKEVQRLLSEQFKARGELERTQARANAAEQRVRAEVTTKTQQHGLQEKRLAKLLQQRALCVIRATEPGLVVYGSTNRRNRWSDNEQIREGTEVRERQELLRIPQRGQMAVKVGLHESVVRQCRVGLQAWIEVDSLPGQRLSGKVTAIARMPSSVDSWLNKDLKVYDTVVSLDGVHARLKPGMSASVEIVAAELEKVLAIPVQAVTGSAESPAAYVADGTGGIVRRDVTLGPSSELIVVIASGLKPGDRVVLDPPKPQSGDSGTSGAGDRPVDSPAKDKRGRRGDAKKNAKKSASKPARTGAGR